MRAIVYIDKFDVDVSSMRECCGYFDSSTEFGWYVPQAHATCDGQMR